MKILIAEDDAVSRRVLELTLAKIGHGVLAVGGGEMAWSVLRSEGAPASPSLTG